MLRRRPRRRVALAIGLALTAFQLTLALSLSPGADRYSKLCAWDCSWYHSIASEGYHSKLPPASQEPWSSNVAFFPGYPILARGLHLATGISPRVALLLVAQAFSFVFWFAWWRLLQRWRIPTSLA